LYNFHEPRDYPGQFVLLVKQMKIKIAGEAVCVA